MIFLFLATLLISGYCAPLVAFHDGQEVLQASTEKQQAPVLLQCDTASDKCEEAKTKVSGEEKGMKEAYAEWRALHSKDLSAICEQCQHAHGVLSDLALNDDGQKLEQEQNLAEVICESAQAKFGFSHDMCTNVFSALSNVEGEISYEMAEIDCQHLGFCQVDPDVATDFLLQAYVREPTKTKALALLDGVHAWKHLAIAAFSTVFSTLALARANCATAFKQQGLLCRKKSRPISFPTPRPTPFIPPTPITTPYQACLADCENLNH